MGAVLSKVAAAGSEHLTSPPRARLAFRVGVVGHRPNRLPGDETGQDAIRDLVFAVLEAVRDGVEAFRSEPDATLYDVGPAILRAISPLAEGSDREFAEAAIELGYALCCPMPFPREEYEKDFVGDQAQESASLERFRGILEQAATGPGLSTFELDGARDDEGAAYGAAGRLVLNQSDLLVVVWDGGKPRGDGGTVQTLREAISYHVPVLWIDARAPFGWSLLREAAQLDCLDGESPCALPWSAPDTDGRRLNQAVRDLVCQELRLPTQPPQTERPEENRRHAIAYFQESRPRRNPFFHWKLFRNLLGSGRLTLPAIGVSPFIDQVRQAWPVLASDVASGRDPPPPVMAEVNASLRGHYAWSDKRADLYADAHRSTNIITSLFAALAVFLALAPMAMGWGPGEVALERICILVELFTMGNIVLFLTLSRMRRWHERWLEYRVLAELIRQLRLLLPLGGGRPLPRSPAHLNTYGDPTLSWMYWQIRAIARSVGLPTVSVTPAYVSACVDDIFAIVDGPDYGQLGFHKASHHRSERIHERLHTITLVLFYSTVLSVLAHLALSFVDSERPPVVALGRWLLLISAVAPALGAALANINNQGEFSRLAKRSRAMMEGFAGFRAQLIALRRGPAGEERLPQIAQVTAVARRVTEMMVDENVDWRVVVVDLPHAGG